MTRRIVIAFVALTAVSAVVGVARQAGAATTSHLTLMSLREDRWRNYDFTEQTVSSARVDWAVSLVFYNNATINRVKSHLGNEYDQTGSRQNGRLSDNVNNGYVWDQDGGRKTTLCPGGPGQPDEARHYRIYADGDDRMYNLDWGYWVFGSDHYDIEECPGGAPAWFGYSETAEGWITWRWRQNGRAAFDDWSWFFNPEPYRVEGDHIWENNGYASALHVP
jgi:hypothetical protein